MVKMDRPSQEVCPKAASNAVLYARGNAYGTLGALACCFNCQQPFTGQMAAGQPHDSMGKVPMPTSHKSQQSTTPHTQASIHVPMYSLCRHTQPAPPSTQTHNQLCGIVSPHLVLSQELCCVFLPWLTQYCQVAPVNDIQGSTLGTCLSDEMPAHKGP